MKQHRVFQRFYLLFFPAILVSCNAFSAKCGNNFLDVDVGEACDDGNNIDADGCEADCSLPACENGIVDPGEFCFQTIRSVGVRESPVGLALGDVNNDGFLDIISTDSVSDEISVLLNNGEGNFVAINSFSAGDDPHSAAFIDLDNDADLDVVVANRLSNDISIFFNNGTGILSASTLVPLPEGSIEPLSITVEDFDRNGTLDFATTERQSDTISIFLHDGKTNFLALKPISIGSGPFMITTGDLDGDGILEFVTANESSNDLSIVLNPIEPENTIVFSIPVGSIPRAAVLVDLDSDTDLDIACINSGDNTITTLRNKSANGVLFFESIGTFPIGDDALSIASGDFNTDGVPDLVTTSAGKGNKDSIADNTVSVLLNDGTGSFAPQIQLDQGARSQQVVVGDLNGDTVPDFATANFDADTVGIFLSTP